VLFAYTSKSEFRAKKQIEMMLIFIIPPFESSLSSMGALGVPVRPENLKADAQDIDHALLCWGNPIAFLFFNKSGFR